METNSFALFVICSLSNNLRSQNKEGNKTNPKIQSNPPIENQDNKIETKHP